jgi:hypothetical protein
VLAAAAMAAIWLAIEPHTVDMAAHTFRADLFGQEGFTIWNGQWYGGHHTPAYSLLFPPLAWLLGPWLAGALAAVAGAAVFEPLVRRQWGDRARWGALWFGLGTGSLLFTGRLPFALGVAIGLGSLLALQRGRLAVAALLAVAASVSSPIAGLFLTLAALTLALASRPRRPGLTVAAAAFVPPALLTAAFPEGGYMPFDFSTFIPVPAMALAALALLPRRERALRIGVAAYALATTAAWLVHTQMGSNAVRLGTLFAGPVLACVVVWPRRRSKAVPLALALLALLLWQWSSAGRDVTASQNEPSAAVSYYKPLLGFLAGQRPERGRVEIPFTRSHWEGAVVAPRFPLARGWERQLDAGRNALFYEGILSDFTYANWLAEHAVRFVALPDVKPDSSSYKERGLIERNPPYLRLIRRLPHWRIYLVRLPHPMVIPDEGKAGSAMKLLHLGSDELELQAPRPGGALIRVRWSPYWKVDGGCVERAGDWTHVTARRPGSIRMTTVFAPARVVFRGRRCG